ncbi:hypothetical protein PANDA_008525 [Ailuropoda melanoleuca]|uniref:Collagen type XXVIII alpha 1 chain n=1 Tax=Ailuropoda melanoleuca TaxID=9646 RepID=D2HD13_AILME|nr:hypothetical protein PANDA_008525 [Ailuropoda melanoleuca]
MKTRTFTRHRYDSGEVDRTPLCLKSSSAKRKLPALTVDSTCFIDVVFIVDSSESSKIILFDKQKDFVDSLSDRVFQLTPVRSLKYDIKLAALQFSSSVQIDPSFSSWKDLQTFKQRVKSMNFIGQGTFSYYAISNATGLLKREGRKDGVKVALLMTDGIDHPKNPDVQSISEDARTAGILFITIGLSTVVNEAKLRLISGDSSSEPIPLLSDPTLVDKIRDRLFKRVLTTEPKTEDSACAGKNTGVGMSRQLLTIEDTGQAAPCLAKLCRLRRVMLKKGILEKEAQGVNQVPLVLMVLQELLVLDNKELRGKEVRKEEQGLRDRLALGSQASQVPVVLREYQERGAYQEKDFQDQRVKKALKDQLAHKDYKARQSKGTRESKVLWVHLVHKGLQDKAHLVPREKLGSPEQEAQKDHLEKDNLAPRVNQELWALLGCLEHQFLDHLGQREIEEDRGSLDLKENLELLFEDQRGPKDLRDQWVLQDSKGMAILVWLDLGDYQDPLDQWAYMEWGTLAQSKNTSSNHLAHFLFFGEPGVRGPPGPAGPRGLGTQGPKVSLKSVLVKIREILGRKACLALLEPLAMDYKELKVSKDLKAFQGQRARQAVASLARSLLKYWCGPKCKETPLELLFVIDSSESVGLENFEIIKSLVKTLSDQVALDLAAARVGIINYSHKVEKVAHLTQFSTKDDFKLAVDRMQYLGEGTYTASALHEANHMFEAARPGVKKVALVITDGQTDTRDEKNLTEVVKKASDINVEIFVIGVVKKNDPNFEVFHKEMNLIATDPDSEHVYQFDDFITLQEQPWTSGVGPPHASSSSFYCGASQLRAGTTRFLQDRPVSVSGVQDEENEPLEPTRADSLTSSPSPEAASTEGPLLGLPEDGAEGLETRTPSPVLDSHPEKLVHKDPRCLEALKPGNCGEYVVRWYYDKQVNSCARFWFSGCNGSGNRFNSEQECQEICVQG